MAIKVYLSGTQIVIEDVGNSRTTKFAQGEIEYVEEADGSVSIRKVQGNEQLTVGIPVASYQNQAGTPYANFAALDADWGGFFTGASPDELLAELVKITANTGGSSGTLGGHTISADETGNSTKVMLTGGATYTGAWEDVTDYSMLAVAIKSGNATDGTLWVDASQDGGVTIINSVPYAVSDTTFFVPKPWNIVESHVRIRYINGTTAHTGFFGMQTKYSNAQESTMLQTIESPLRREDAVSNIKNVNNHNDDRNIGVVTFQQSKRKFGKNEAVGAGSFETVWTYSTNWIPAQVAETIRIRSGGSAADTAAGLGAQTVEVTFLDDSWNEVTETLTTAGASASAATTALCYRVLSARVKNVGTYHAANTGDIVIEQITSAAVMGFMLAGTGTTEQSIYTVPAGHTMYITEIFVSVGQADSADIRLIEVDNADDFTTPFSAKHEEWSIEDFTGAAMFKQKTHLKFDEKTDIFFESKRITGSGSARVSVDFNFYLVTNA